MDFCHQSMARSMLMLDAFDNRSGSRMPYGMATITIEMAIAP